MAVVLAMLSVELSQEGFLGAVITGKDSTLHPTGAPAHRPKVAAAAASNSSGAGMGTQCGEDTEIKQYQMHHNCSSHHSVQDMML